MSDRVKKRLAWIDWAKAICIFTMVMGHCWCPSPLVNLIYSFHMPALFFLSGYLFKPLPIKQNILSLYVPVLVISSINLLFWILYYNEPIPATFSRLNYWGYIGDVSLQRGIFVGYWFIASLFLMKLFMSFCFLRRISCNILILFTLIMVFFIDRGYDIGYPLMCRYSIPAFIFFYVGYTLKNKLNKSFFKICILIPLIFVYIYFSVTSDPCSIFGNEYSRYGYVGFVLNAFVGIYILLGICFRLPKTSTVETISSGTLLLLGFHKTLFYIMIDIIPGVLAKYMPYLGPVMIVCVLLPIINFCITKCPWILGRGFVKKV